MNYGTVIDNTLHPAPRAFMLHGAMVTNPKAEHFAALNVERAKQDLPPYLEVVDKWPSADTAHYAVAIGWTRDGETWRRVYEVRELPPPPPRTFVTADVIEALAKAGVWPRVRSFLDERGMIDMVLATKEFVADDPNFTGPRDALKELLGWTDEQVEAVLAAGVKDS